MLFIQDTTSEDISQRTAYGIFFYFFGVLRALNELPSNVHSIAFVFFQEVIQLCQLSLASFMHVCKDSFLFYLVNRSLIIIEEDLREEFHLEVDGVGSCS